MRFPLFLLTVFLLLALSACSPTTTQGAGLQPDPRPTPVDPGRLAAEGWALPTRSTVLSFAAGGKLGEIHVHAGQAVRQGDLLASLGDRELLQAGLAQAHLEQLAAQQALDELNDRAGLQRALYAQAVVDAQQALIAAGQALNDLDTEAFRDELEDRDRARDRAQDRLDEAAEKLDEHQDLPATHTTRKNAQEVYDRALHTYKDALYDRDTWQNQLDRAQAAVGLAQAQLDQAQRDLDAYQDGPDSDQLALAHARLENAEKQAAAAQTALDNAALTAPYAATVADVNALEPGEYLAPGTPLVILADYSGWVVETRDLSELDVVSVAVGQAVSVTPDALPELQLRGVVTSIDLVFTERSDDILYTAHIRLDETDPRLRWGMTVTVTFP